MHPRFPPVSSALPTVEFLPTNRLSETATVAPTPSYQSHKSGRSVTQSSGCSVVVVVAARTNGPFLLGNSPCLLSRTWQSRGSPEGTRAAGSIGETALKFPLAAGKWQLLHESRLAKGYITEAVADDVNFANKLRHESRRSVFFFFFLLGRRAPSYQSGGCAKQKHM